LGGRTYRAVEGGTLAILVKRFPRLSETFVLNEIVQLRDYGLPVSLHAVMDPREPHVHPEAEALRDHVCYLRSGSGIVSSIRLTPDVLASALRHPGGTLKGVQFALGRRSAATWRHLAEALVLAGHLKRERAAHLHAHFAHGPAAIAYLAHLVTGIPFSFTAHAKDLYTTPSEYVTQRGRAASFVVTCTEANREYLAQLLGEQATKVMVCRHGVDLARFGSIVREPIPGRILSVGRLVPKKGFDTLLRALGILADRGVPFDCRIVGGGALAGDLRALAASVSIEQRVRFLGARPQTMLLQEYAQAEVFALAPVVTQDGDRDGIPNVLREGMASSVPVVSTAISGIPELIRDGETGLLVPPRDPTALADALQLLLSDSGIRKRLAEAGRRWVSSHCDLTECVRPLAAVFEERLGAIPDLHR
jgi:glycosyltransferase involved in cell wall biosynthesis